VSTSAPVDSPQPAAPVRKRGLRRMTKVVFGLILLLGLLIITVQIILMTTIPERIVIAAVEQKSGLSLTAKSVDTGWFGRSTLRDVAVSLPLSQSAFVQIPELQVTHSWLFWVVLTQDVTIKYVHLQSPTFTVQQGPSGDWNLQDVVRLLGRMAGSNEAQQKDKQNQIPFLPSVQVDDGAVNIQDNRGRIGKVEHIYLTGKPRTAVAYQYDLGIEKRVSVHGELAPGGDWAHKVSFDVEDVAPWVTPFFSKWPALATVKGAWNGALVNGRIDGRLQIDDLRFGHFSAAGPLEIKAEEAGTGIYPQGLQLGIDGKENFDTALVGGSLLVNAAAVESRTLVAAVAGGHFNIDGKYQWADQSATMSVAWNGVQIPATVEQSGNLTVSISAPYSWQKTIAATLNTHGDFAQGKWNANFDISGQGPTWDQLAWSIAATNIEADNGGHEIDLQDLTASIAMQRSAAGSTLTLQSLTNSADMVSGSGCLNLTTLQWWVTVDGRGWPLPRHANQTMDVDLDLWGDHELTHLKQLYLRTGQLESWSDGEYVYDRPEPVDANVYIEQQPEKTAIVINGQNVASTQPIDTQEDLVQGSLSGDAHLVGKLLPTHLTFTCHASGSDLVIEHRPLGDLTVTTTGSINERADERIVVVVDTSELKLFGGNWKLEGWYPTEGMDSHTFRLYVTAENAAIEQLANNPNVQGKISGTWVIDIQQPNLDGISVSSHAVCTDVKIFTGSGGKAVQRAAIARIDIPRLTLFQDTMRADGVQLLEPVDPSFGVAGAATASASLSLTNPTQIDVSLRTGIHGWIVDPNIAGLEARVDVSANKLQIDTALKAARGHVDLDAVFNWRKPALATLKTSIDMQGRIAEVQDLNVKLLGGSAEGGAVIDLDHLYQSVAELQWHGLQSDQFADLFPRTHRLNGSFAGLLKIEPATDRYALAPESVHLELTPEKGSYGAVALNGVVMNAYLGPDRFVLDGRPDHATTLSVGGGTVTVWARLSRHVDDIMQSQADITVQNVDIDQIMRTISPKSANHQGILSATCTILFQPAIWRQMSASGNVQLTDSNLADFGPIAFLYNAMHLLVNMNTPTGKGAAELQLERGTLTIVRARYFNKGTEVRASGTIQNIFNAPNSPLNIVGVGSANPLSTIHLPVIADVSGIVNAIQNSLITEQITGTLGKPLYNTLPFASVTQGFKEFITGDVRNEVKGGAD
jgi:hypothetical protein